MGWPLTNRTSRELPIVALLLVSGHLGGHAPVVVALVDGVDALRHRVDVVQHETVEVGLEFQRLEHARVDQLGPVERPRVCNKQTIRSKMASTAVSDNNDGGTRSATFTVLFDDVDGVVAPLQGQDQVQVLDQDGQLVPALAQRDQHGDALALAAPRRLPVAARPHLRVRPAQLLQRRHRRVDSVEHCSTTPDSKTKHKQKQDVIDDPRQRRDGTRSKFFGSP